MRIAVLGAGLVGGPMGLDLAPDHDVTVVDVRREALDRVSSRAEPGRLRAVQADLRSRAEVQRIAEEHDLVLSAVPSAMGFETLRAILESGTSCVDIAFFSEDPLELDGLAKANGVTAIVDMGVNPGMGGVLAAHAHGRLATTRSILSYVGGLPRTRRWPYEYAAVFAPMDVIEEYVRPARYVENGALVVRPALSDPEYVDFPEVGTLEAFNTDGLRTMAKTMNVPNMKEKTLRYPGHIEKMAVLRETGFFGTDPVEVGGVRVSPRELTAKLLFPMWKLGPGEEDVTVMRVVVEGETPEGARVRYRYDLLDRYDAKRGVHSMARTTGYTATAAVRMLARGLFAERGVFPPELVGRNPACVEFLLAELAARGVVYEQRVETLA